MGRPHKHAELIKAWADGAEIEYRSRLSGHWDAVKEPGWYLDYEYRIKSGPKVGYVNIYPVYGSPVLASRDEADKCAGDTRIACVRVTYTEGQFDE